MSTDHDPTVISVEQEAEMCILRVDGAVSDEGTMKLRSALNRALEERAPRIVVDFTSVDYISSSGIGMLVSVLKRCHESDTAFALCGLNEDLRELFNLTRLDQVFSIVSDPQAWASALG